MVIGNLHVCSIPVYALFDLVSTLYFVTPLVASKFDLLHEILHDSFIGVTPIGENIRVKKVYKECPINNLYIFTHDNELELSMVDFNIILGMDWLQKFYATIDYRNRVVRFKLLNELELKWEGSGSNPTRQIDSNIKANKMLSK